MQNIRWTVLAAALSVACSTPALPYAIPAPSPMQAQPAISTRLLGTVTAISGNSVTVKPDNGQPVTVTVSESARIMRLAAGQTRLSEATPIALTDIAAGDRVLIATLPGEGTTLTARLVVAMKQADIARKQQAEEIDWQRRGIGGIVKSIDPATGTLLITSGAHSIAIKTSSATTVRQYAPDSVAFQDARPSSVTAIHPGDQLRAKGDHSPEGTEFTADAIVFGSFHNIAGPIVAIDSAAQTLTVRDLATKQPVTLQVDSQSQLRKLDPKIAQMIAQHLKASSGGESHPLHAEGGEGPGGAAAGDFSRVLQRSPTIQLADLHKGDAVMIVATRGSGAGPANAVTLLAGVEPMLQASASASESIFSSSWSLDGGAQAGDAGSQ
jgi:Domain of unknown function (DUF5666)